MMYYYIINSPQGAVSGSCITFLHSPHLNLSSTFSCSDSFFFRLHVHKHNSAALPLRLHMQKHRATALFCKIHVKREDTTLFSFEEEKSDFAPTTCDLSAPATHKRNLPLLTALAKICCKDAHASVMDESHCKSSLTNGAHRSFCY